MYVVTRQLIMEESWKLWECSLDPGFTKVALISEPYKEDKLCKKVY